MKSSCYRPKRSFGQGNIFTPVCHSFCSQGEEYLTRPDTPPPRGQAGTPPDQAGTPPLGPGRYTPPDQAGKAPPPHPDSGIRSTIGWYASYWNAIALWKFYCSRIHVCTVYFWIQMGKWMHLNCRNWGIQLRTKISFRFTTFVVLFVCHVFVSSNSYIQILHNV